MASPTDHPASLAERLIAGTIAATWVLWLIGGLYFAGPLLGWTLGAMACARLYLGHARPPGALVMLWLGGMAVMLVALLVGHIENDLGAAQTLKSVAGWAKGWALLALFPLAGAVLPIRSSVIVRATCRLGAQSLALIPIFAVAPYVGLPKTLWVSPLVVLGGSGPEYFSTILYTFEPGTSAPRWQFFAPWSPAIGFVAAISALIAGEERHRGWRAIGIAAALAMALMSQSRLALVAIVLAWPTAWLVARFARPSTWFAAAPGALLAGFFAQSLLALAQQATSDFNGARAASSRVRATLGRIAVERWRNEAPWFGHGIVERGPHLVEYMPIGSHHSWFGLLFVKGLVGVLALAVPLFGSLILTAVEAGRLHEARRALALLFVLLLYSFGENLEVLGYLIWPGLILIGTAARSDAKRGTARS
ncbi:O-antigen ligase domain-containing protein [Sphingomonas sp. SUN039]|uniref:O-antigen ligase domain-containing protein n=1 Tax=Sphingomonas sp. SUN039 TaxID=2937787 RepID=UPI002164A58E|nr:O-antigen ligase domain-containing protein [Sphingomonas sp. SUN039]UVO52753.1 O-antigen ligase domain-containing protein [Sphingomonas sp. SUN039]